MKEAAFQISQEGQVQIFQVRDLLSEYGHQQLLGKAQELIDGGYRNFIVDLREAPVMNSVGLNFLINLRGRSNDQGGQLVICNVSSRIVDLLDMTRVRPLFELCEDLDQALSRFARS